MLLRLFSCAHRCDDGWRHRSDHVTVLSDQFDIPHRTTRQSICHRNRAEQFGCNRSIRRLSNGRRHRYHRVTVVLHRYREEVFRSAHSAYDYSGSRNCRIHRDVDLWHHRSVDKSNDILSSTERDTIQRTSRTEHGTVGHRVNGARLCTPDCLWRFVAARMLVHRRHLLLLSLSHRTMRVYAILSGI